MTALIDKTALQQRLITELERLAAHFPDMPLSPTNGKKQPQGKGWQKNPYTPAQMIEAVKNGIILQSSDESKYRCYPKGFGLITGRPVIIDGKEWYLMTLDLDGASASAKILELAGGEELPVTPTHTSGREGRCQCLFKVSPEYASALRSKSIPTGVSGEQVEFIWLGRQSVLPSSVHPETGCYFWKEGRSIYEVPIAELPQWALEQMRVEQTRQPVQQHSTFLTSTEEVPLYQFLTKDDRALIDQGVEDGRRNTSGAKLSRNLIGTANRLNELGIRFAGDPRQLFDDFGHQCNPALDSKVVNTIWESAEKSNPKASLSDDTLENCAKAWVNKHSKSSGRGYGLGSASKSGSRKSSSKPNSPSQGNSNGGDGSGDNGGFDGSNDDLPPEPNHWNAPVSWHGEIGWLFEEKQSVTEENEDGEEIPVIGEDGQPLTEKVSKFQPKANFDFVVERELESEDGGGVVLQVKRSLDRVEKRVVIKSVDYGSVKTFEKALKQALGSGIVINLKDEHLKALIHVRLREYRERGGKTYKLIDRYGQQADGVWVFRERQFKPDGTPTNEEESGWVFNPALGKEDFIPCPELASNDSEALKRLVDACRKFFGERNIHQVLMTMGWVVAGLHSQEIFKHDNCFPLINPNGEPGACKTLGAEAALSLVGKNWAQMGMLARVSTSALYEHGARTGSLPFLLDDPERSRELDEVLKTWFNWKPRRVRGNDQQPKSPLGAITNHVAGAEQAAAFTRFMRLTYERNSNGNKQAFQELRAAQETASGAFPQLLKIGYDPNAIAAIELDLLPYLPLAHARIAQSLAIPLYYGQKIVELTGGSDNLKQWVIENCCTSENDSDNSADSLQDFIDKLLSLEAESRTGSWNLKRNVERDGKIFTAIYAADVWALVDARFKPATYNFKSLKPLVLKAGGVIDKTERFDRSQDQRLAYERALISPRTDCDGNTIPPTLPDTIPRKAWLIPSELFDSDNKISVDPTPGYQIHVTGVTGCNRDSVTTQNVDLSTVSSPSEVACNCVTEKKEIEIKLQELDEPITEIDAEENYSHEVPENPGYTSYTVTGASKTTTVKGLQAVTEIPENPVTAPKISVTKAIASSPAATSVETDASSLASEMPDFDLFPDSPQTASRAMKKHKAMEIKCRFEACQTADDFLALKDSYTNEELNWVRRNMISKTERARFTRTIEEAGLAAQRS